MPTIGKKSQHLDFMDIDTLEKLLDIGQSLTTVRDLSVLLKKVAKAACSILNADAVVLYEYQADMDDVIIPPTVWGKLRQPRVLKEKRRDRTHRDSLVFRVLKRSQPIYATDAVADWANVLGTKAKRTGESGGFVQREGIVSSAAVRLAVRKNTVGAIFVNYRTPHIFNEEEKRIFELFATQAATVIQNAKLFRLEREQRQRAETLHEVAQIVNSTLSLDRVVDLVLDDLGKVIRYTRASIQLIQGDHLVLVGGRGFSADDSPSGLFRNVSDDPLISEYVRRRKPMVLSEVVAEPRWEILPATANVKSWMGCPLVLEDQVIGLLTLDYDEPGYYTQKSGDLVAAFANQVAVAIRNSTQVRTLAKLNHLTQQLTHVVESPQDATNALLSQIAEDALEILSADIIEFYEYEKEQNRIRLPPVSMGERRGPSVPRLELRRDDVVLALVAEAKPLYIESAQTQEIFVAPFVDRPEGWPVERFVFREGIVSSAFIPLRTGSETVGFMFVSYRTPQKFTSERTELIELFANQAAIALKNAGLLISLERQVRGHRMLSALGSRLLERLDEETILGVVARFAANTIDCTHCFVLRVEGPQVVIRAAEGNRGWSLPKGRAFRLGQGVNGWVAQTGEPVLVLNTSLEPRFDTGWSAPQPDPLSLVVVPISLESKVYGVISIEHDRVGAFDQQDQQLALTLASQASQALRNTRLYADLELQVQRDKTLNQIGRELSTRLDVETIYGAVAEAVVQTLDCTHCTLFALEGSQLVPHASHGSGKGPAVTRRFALGEGLVGQVVQEAKPLLVRDASKHAHFIAGQTRPQAERSLIVVPVKAGDQVVAVISADQDRINAFDERDAQMVETLALQAGAAFQNARLFDEAQRRIRDLEIVNDVAQDISAKLDTRNLFETIVSRIAAQLNCVQCTLFLLQEQDGEPWLIPQKTHGVRPEIMTRRFKRDEGLVGWVFQHGESLVLPDVRDDLRFSPARNVKELPRSMLVTPVKIGEQTIGVISADQDQFNWFSENDQRLVNTLAKQAAIAIENARLYEELRRLYEDLQRRVRYLNALNQISQQAKELLDLRQLFEQVVHEAQTTLNADRCTLFVLSDEGVLVPQAMEGMDKKLACLTFALGEGLAGWVAQEGRSERVRDAQHDPRFVTDATVRSDKPRSMVLAPLWVEGKVEGVLSVDRENDTPFDEDDQRFVETLAVQTGILWRQIALRVQRMDGFKRQRNPYVVGEPIRNPEGFFGRWPLIQQIVDGIHQNNFILYGERRIGKTSVLFQIERRLSEVSKQPDKYFFLPIFASLQGISEPEFFDFLIGRIADATGQPRGSGHGLFGLEDLLKRVVPELQTWYPERKVRLVLLLDEMDQFTQYSSTTHELFRSVAQTRVGEHLKMIMTGVSVHRVAQLRTSPWYNLFEGIEIPELDEVDGRQLVIEPVRGYYHYAPDALHLLLDRTDYKPCEIQRLGWHSVNVMLTRVRAAGHVLDDSLTAVIDIVSDDVIAATVLVLAEKDGEYRELWAQFHTAQQAVLHEAHRSDGRLRTALVGVGDKALFTPEQLYNITRHSGGQWRLTYFFDTWLKGLNT